MLLYMWSGIREDLEQKKKKDLASIAVAQNSNRNKPKRADSEVITAAINPGSVQRSQSTY